MNKYLSIITLCKWIKCSNQKTQGIWMAKKTWPTCAAYKRPTSEQNTYTDWKWKHGKNIPSKWKGKKSQCGNIYIRQIYFKTKIIKRDTEGYFIILRGRIHQEDINIVNICTPQRTTQIYKENLFKKDIDSNTILVGNFNTPLSKMDTSPKQNINQDIVTLNNALDQMDLTYMYRTFIPKEGK